MGSTEPERSLSGGFSLPQWMKHKVGDRYDFDDTVSFSPPSHDDSFFYIRYPKGKTHQNDLKLSHQPHAEDSSRPKACTSQQHEGIPKIKLHSTQKHECSTSTMKKPLLVNEEVKRDGACTDSVIKVAYQMSNQISSNQSSTLSVKQGDMNLVERVCKSLPATPFATPSTTPESSPRIPRKNAPLPNRYFTGSFAANEGSQSSEQSSVYTGSWLFTSLLGQRDPVTAVVDRPGTLVPITETDESTRASPELRRNKSEGQLLSPTKERKESDSSSPIQSPDTDSEHCPSVISAIEKSGLKEVKIVKPKPSELREMNFWSPTSM